jgi:hypothetical protein
MNLKIFLFCILILVSGCSGTYHAYYQTLKIAFSEQQDTKINLVEAQESDIDIISVKRGERSASIMALAYIENGQHKWVSSDSVMLILEKGRLIRTLGLNKNLLYLSNSEIDPIKSLFNSQKDKSQSLEWSFTVDLTGDQYGYPINSTFGPATQDTVQILNLDMEATLFVEKLHYQAPSAYIQLNNKWQNYYWYAESGELIKSIQKLSPISEALEITYLSRIARLTQ